MEESTGYFDRHGEQLFIAQSLGVVIFIIFAKSFLRELIPFLMFLTPIAFVIYLRYQITATDLRFFEKVKEHITFIPLIRNEEERRAEIVPWITYFLIFLNIFIFYVIELSIDPQQISENLVFVPEQPNFWNLPISALTAMFIHSGNGHLWGNMTFLWVVGSAVERRMDRGSYLFLYIFTGLVGSILFVLVEYVANDNTGHMLGASGAIAGIMGIYAVRCYFKSMIFPVPLLGIFSLIFPISLKIRLNALVIIGLFFYSDLSGGLSQLAGHYSPIGHWVHLGGMISGMLAAWLVLNLGKKAIEERHLDLGIKAVETYAPVSEGEKSLAIVLEQNPDCGEALLALAKLKSRVSATEEGRTLYLKALVQFLESSPNLAVKAFQEFTEKFSAFDLEPHLVERLGYAAMRLKERSIAIKCFNLLSNHPKSSEQMREKALLMSGKLLEEQGEIGIAYEQYARLVEEFPNADVVAKLKAKLAGEPVPQMLPSPAQQVEDRAIHQALQPAEGAGPICPACNNPMSRKRANNGTSKGAMFWVCPSYPTCKGVIPVDEPEMRVYG